MCTRSSCERHLPFDLQVSRNIPLRHINPRRSAHYDRKGLIAICKSHRLRHAYAANITHIHTRTRYKHTHAHIPLRLQLRSRNPHRLHYLSIERLRSRGDSSIFINGQMAFARTGYSEINWTLILATSHLSPSAQWRLFRRAVNLQSLFNSLLFISQIRLFPRSFKFYA